MQNYQIGGSLRSDAPCYVERQADRQLCEALERGEFCYVLNSRQMGKSSLLVRTLHRLEAAGYRCCTVDITGIGSENITPKQWYKGVISELWKGFLLHRQQNFRHWWAAETDVAVVRRLRAFIADVLLAQFPNDRFVIFIDEIDSTLSLPFSTDDFFAFIRFCYNQRALDADYKRLTFAVFGVATPSDLIQDRQRTPFNIGKAIELRGFTLAEVRPLMDCLGCETDVARAVLTEILQWTGGQPFLTQKICQLACDCSGGPEASEMPLRPGHERAYVERIVRHKIVRNWEFQDEPEHLRTIRARLQHSSQRSGRLLEIYLRILQGEAIALDESSDQAELLLSGLVSRDGDCLSVKNRIYAEVFDCNWVAAQLDLLRPYARALEAWLASERTDNSRLLRGQALQDARDWSQGKSLGEVDYQYLADSEALDRYELQQELEAGRAAAAAAQLLEERRRRHQEQKNMQLQRYLLGALTTILLVLLGLGTEAFLLYRRALLSEIEALATSSLAASADSRFNSQSQLDALVRAIRAKRLLGQVAGNTRPRTVAAVETALQRAIHGIAEVNRFSGHREAVAAVAFGPDGHLLATAGADASIQLWRADGTAIGTLVGHRGPIRALAFSADGRWLATAGEEAEIYLWQPPEPANSADPTIWSQARLVRRLDTGMEVVRELAFHPHPTSTVLAAAGSSSRLQLWSADTGDRIGLWGPEGTWERARFSPDGTLLAAVGGEGRVALGPIGTAGSPAAIAAPISGRGPLRALAFAPSGDLLALAGEDGAITLWQQQPDATWQLLSRLLLSDAERPGPLAFSPDGEQLAAAGDAGTIWLWQAGLAGWGTPVPPRSLQGHSDRVTAVAFSPDGRTLASTSRDRTVRLWQPDNPLRASLVGHQAAVTGAAFTPDGGSIVSVSRDRTARLWQADGRPIRTFSPDTVGLRGLALSPVAALMAVARGNQGMAIWPLDDESPVVAVAAAQDVATVAFRADGRRIATGGRDRAVRLWHPDGRPAALLRGHTGAILDLAFSPTDKFLASASADKTIGLWNEAGELHRTLYGHSAPVAGVAFGPRGQILASASHDRTLKLWRRDGTLLQNLVGHQDAVLAVAIGGPAGKIIASGSRDRTVRLWQRGNPHRSPLVLSGHRAAVRDVALSPDGKWLLSTGEDNRMLLWNLAAILESDTLVAACRWVGDYLRTNTELTPEERLLCRGVADDMP